MVSASLPLSLSPLPARRQCDDAATDPLTRVAVQMLSGQGAGGVRAGSWRTRSSTFDPHARRDQAAGVQDDPAMIAKCVPMRQIGALRFGELGEKPGFLRVEPHRYDELDRMTLVDLDEVLVDRVEVRLSCLP